MADDDLTKRIEKLEAELYALRERISSAEGQETRELVRTLREQIALLTSEKERLLQTIDRLKAERIRPTPTQLVDSFRNAMNALRASLEPKPGERIGYTVSHFDVDLKSFISVDKRDLTVRMVLPEPGEQFPVETLSTVRFVFQTVPKPESPDQPLVEVPMVLDLDKEKAIGQLEVSGLKRGTIIEEPSSSPTGTVIRQNPDGGDFVPPETEVNLVVARPAQIEVPNLLKLKRAAAEERIQDIGLRVGSLTEEFSKESPGIVIRQSPAGGLRVAIGSEVDLVIAKAETVRVPNLIGHKESDALKILKRARLLPGVRTTRRTEEGTGLVLEQSPVADAELPLGGKVDFVIGVADSVKVPDLVTMSVENAKQALEKVRLVMGLITTRRHPRLDRVVISQDPEQGKEVPLRTPVNIVIARLWTMKEITALIAEHPEFQKVGVPVSTLMNRLNASRFNSPETFGEIRTFPDVQLVADLGLPNIRSATTLKKIIKEIMQ